MNNDPVVSVRNVSKRYLLYDRPQDRLKQSLFWRFGKNYAREFWALRDINFDLRRGEAVGIIGRNGSGKSTLLQIITGTLTATEGDVRVKGRVAALLELGSGFEMEFSGRENVYINGAIMGFSRKEMDKRFEEIADYADIGHFIDQPVKIYSNGMFVRLAFAVQILLDPDVLIVDEALAVGDVAFQIKCMRHMKNLCDRGVTILVVTHDIQTVRSFCDRVIWLHDGSMKNMGSPLVVTSQYVQHLVTDCVIEDPLIARKVEPLVEAEQIPLEAEVSDELVLSEAPTNGISGVQVEEDVQARREGGEGLDCSEYPWIHFNGRKGLIRWGSGEIIVEAARIDNGQLMKQFVFEYGERFYIELVIHVLQDVPSADIGLGLSFRNTKGLDVIVDTTYDTGYRFPFLHSGQVIRAAFELDNILAPGDYALVLNIEDRGQFQYYDFIENAVMIKVVSERKIFSLVLPPVKRRITLGTRFDHHKENRDV